MLILVCLEKRGNRTSEGVEMLELVFNDHFLRTFFFRSREDRWERLYSSFLDFVNFSDEQAAFWPVAISLFRVVFWCAFCTP